MQGGGVLGAHRLAVLPGDDLVPAYHAGVETRGEGGDPVLAVVVDCMAHGVELWPIVGVGFRVDGGPVIGVAICDVGNAEIPGHVLLGGQHPDGATDGSRHGGDVGMAVGPGAGPNGQGLAPEPEKGRITSVMASESIEAVGYFREG